MPIEMSAEMIVILIVGVLLWVAIAILGYKIIDVQKEVDTICSIVRSIDYNSQDAYQRINAICQRTDTNYNIILDRTHLLETMIDLHSEMDIQALRLLTDEIKRLDGEMKEMGLKVKDVNDYVNMMDDTVISTIRDEYAILEEIKEEFLSEKGNI